IGIVLPTLAVMLWYAAIGKFDFFYISNIAANQALVGKTAPPFNLQGLVSGLRQYDFVVLGTAAALIVGPFLARPSERIRSWLIFLSWLRVLCLSFGFLARFADPFFIQTLPMLSVASGWFLAVLAEKLPLNRMGRSAILTAIVLLAGAWGERSE